MQSQTLEQLTPNAAQTILANLPERIRTAFIDRAAEINYPVEALIEMALAGYLDSESIGFVDCKPNRGRG
jgi:flagellar motor switch protein FliG